MFLKLLKIVFILLIQATATQKLHSQNDSIETLLSPHFRRLYEANSDEVKFRSNDTIKTILLNYLLVDSSFTYKPAINRLGKVSSDDKRLNIYTWNFQTDMSKYYYGCIIQHKTEKEQLNVHYLEDNTDEIPLNKTLKKDEWYGCLYYSITVKKRRKKTYYTLLGWDGNDNVVARKMIDVLTFSNKGEPELGENIFKTSNGTQKRVLFRFSASGSMTLVWDEKYRRIIFDHLSPAYPELEGQYQFYGPDFSYDGFRYKKGKWVFEEMLDPRNRD